MEPLKKIIRSIVVSSPRQVTVEQLLFDYKEIEGSVLPFRTYGYANADQMLRRGMRDVVQVIGFGANATIVPVNSSKSEHIAKLVREQKPAQRKRSRVRRNAYEPTNRLRNSNMHLNRFPRQKNDFRKPIGKRTYAYENRNGYKPDGMSSVKEEVTPSEELERSSVQQENEDCLNWSSSNTSSDSVISDTEQNIQEVLHKAVDSRALALEMLRAYQSEISEKEQKSHSTEDLDVDRPEKINNYNKIEAQVIEIETLVETFSSSKISEERTFLDLSDIPSLPDTESTCSDIFFKPKETDDCDDLNEAVPKFAFNNRIFLLDFPESTVRFGTKIEPFTMPDDITVDSIISIYITEIHNPYRFWFHMHRESSQLDELMLSIERFYAPMRLTQEYTIIQELIQPGQVCAALFSDMWHRAEILTNIIIDNNVKVFFMDYGTVHDVDISMLKYLRAEFAELPAFAFRGCLAEIIPARLHWSTASSLYLLSLSYERLLHAKVCEIDAQNRVYYLTVCDTHEGKVLHLNRELVLKKYAFRSSEWSKSKQLNIPRMRHKREDYPTFDMLEAGEYPTLCDLINMEADGICYESITDKMVYHTHILNFDKNLSEALKDLPYYLLSNNPFASDIISELKEKTLANKTEETS